MGENMIKLLYIRNFITVLGEHIMKHQPANTLKSSAQKMCWLKKPAASLLLAFLIPFLGVGLTVLIRAWISKSGNATFVFSMLNSDAYHQYFPFFKEYRRAILAGENLLFSWSVGMGVDYLGLIAYYLGSPLNLLSVLVPEAQLVNYFTLLNPIRLGLAGLFFALMLRRIFGKTDFSIAIFGAFYATCAWSFGYMWCSMWVDTFALLPLVVMGTYSLLKDRKFVLYTVSLFFSVAINYYIGFFTCIFTLLVFICYEICRWAGFRRFAADLGLMALFTVLAIGMTAFITLPTLASLQTTSSSVNEFPTSFRLNITEENTFLGLLDAMRQVATNTFALVTPNKVASEGLPNIYCGVFANIFIFLFLTGRRTHWRDRVCAVVLLLFLNVSFILRQLDYIWHGFHFTNMIPYRFSFLYSFVMLYLAYRAWIMRRYFRPWQIWTAMGLTVLMLLFSKPCESAIETLSDPAFWQAVGMLFTDTGAAVSALSEYSTADMLMPFANGILLIAYLIGLLCCIRKKPAKSEKPAQLRKWHQQTKQRRATASLFLLGVMGVELLLNMAYFATYCPVVNLSSYPRGMKNMQTIVSVMQELEEDTLFYRAETTRTQTHNDGALNGYHGVSIFSSSANASVTTFMKALGYSAQPSWNKHVFEESSPVSNLFLNLKYMIEQQGKSKDNPYFTDIHQSGTVHLLENNYYLPLGFMVDPAMAEVSVSDWNETFDFQTQLLSAALGEPVEVWHYVEDQQLSIASTDDVTLTSTSPTGVASYSSNANGGSVFYTYTFQEEGLFCLYYNMPKRNKITLSYDGGDGYETVQTGSYSVPFSMSVCQVKPGDRVQLTLQCGANESSTLRVWGAVCDQAVMDQAYETFSRSTLELTSFSNTQIEGTVTCLEDGLLYTSIPQSSDNWKVYVDGQPAQVTLIGEAMVGVLLEKGDHTVTFRYESRSFAIGLGASITCAVCFAALSWFVYVYLKKHPGKFTKK